MAAALMPAELPGYTPTTAFTETVTIRFLQIHFVHVAGSIPNGEARHRRQPTERVRRLRSLSRGIGLDINLPNHAIRHTVVLLLSATIRPTLARETPSFWLMSHWLRPCWWSSRTLERSTTTLGLPTALPCARARSRPALTRSERRTRSCLAMVARIDSTASRNGPMERRYSSLSDHQSIPFSVSRWRCWSVSRTPSLANRSRDQNRTRSNLRSAASRNSRWNSGRLAFLPLA